MTLWGHALFSPCTATDCLHFANQSVAMVTHPSPSPTKTPISIPHPPHRTILPCLAHTDFPSLYDSMYCLIIGPSSQVGKESTDHKNKSTQTPKQSLSPTKIYTWEEILVEVSRKNQHVVWKEKVYFSPISQKKIQWIVTNHECLEDPAFVLTSPIALRLVN